MAKENSNTSKNVIAEAQRLSHAINKLLAEESAAPEAGVIALSMSIGQAIKQFSKPENLDDNLNKTLDTIKRVARNQPLTK